MSYKNAGLCGKSQCSEKVPLCPKPTDPGGGNGIKLGSDTEQIDFDVVNDLSDQDIYDFMAFHTGTQAADCCPDKCASSPQGRRRSGLRMESLALVVVTIIALLAVLFWWFNNCNNVINEYLP